MKTLFSIFRSMMHIAIIFPPYLIYHILVTVAITSLHHNILPVNALAGSKSMKIVLPDFYSDIVSPLAKLAAHCAINGEQVPAILDHEFLASLLEEQLDYPTTTTTRTKSVLTATFAGGCFWGIQLAYDREPGVLATCVGYTQGNPLKTYPTYSTVCAEETGHTEACLVAFNPAIVSYAHLAELMFDRIPDPTMFHRVGKDRGSQYRTGLYAHSEEHLADAQVAFNKENKMWFGREVVTEVKCAGPFWPAEEHHQRYLEKGGRFGRPQSSQKGSKDDIRCYG